MTNFDGKEWLLFAQGCLRRSRTPDPDYSEKAYKQAACYAYARACGEGGATARAASDVSEEGEGILMGWMHLHKRGSF